MRIWWGPTYPSMLAVAPQPPESSLPKRKPCWLSLTSLAIWGHHDDSSPQTPSVRTCLGQCQWCLHQGLIKLTMTRKLARSLEIVGVILMPNRLYPLLRRRPGVLTSKNCKLEGKSFTNMVNAVFPQEDLYHKPLGWQRFLGPTSDPLNLTWDAKM